MIDPHHPGVLIGVSIIAAVLIRWHLWRAILVIAPKSIRIMADSPPGMATIPSALEKTHDALLALGFEHLGTHLEHPRLGRPLLTFDYVHREHQTFASVTEGKADKPRLYFFTPIVNDAFVLTADHRRFPREVKGRYLSGGLEGASAERLLKAHLRRVPELGDPSAEWTLDGRVAAARVWFDGVGRAEVRQQNAVGLLWTLGALGMVGAAIFGRSG